MSKEDTQNIRECALTMAQAFPNFGHMRPVPLYFYYDDPEVALKAAKAAGKRKGCEYQGWKFPEGKGFAVWKEGFVIEKHIIRG